MKIRSFGLLSFVSALIAVLLFSSVSYGDGFRNPPASAGGLGVAGNNVVFAEGAGALFHNPANILFSGEPEVEAGVVFARLKTEYDSMRGSETSDAEWQILPNLYATYPLDEGVSAGLSVTFPYGQSVDWDRDGVFKYVAPYHVEMSMVDIGPAIACRLGESLLLGAGLDIYSSDLEIKQSYRWANIAPGAPDGDAKLKGDGQGYGGNLGLTWLMGERQRLAFRYRSAFSIDYEGSARISNVPAATGGYFAESSHFSTELDFPEQYAAGYGVDLVYCIT